MSQSLCDRQQDTVDEGSSLTFTAAASDVDATDSLTYSLVGAPAGATINATTVRLSPGLPRIMGSLHSWWW